MFRVDHYHHFPDFDEALVRMKRIETLIVKNQEKIMGKMEDLEAAVERNTSVDDSVVTLLNGIAQQLRDAQGDPAKIDAVIAKLDANTQKMSDAVIANTPSA